MPKYELMYLIGSDTPDEEIPKIVAEVKKYIEDGGGIIEKTDELGKKKLAYPIKRTKIGYYMVVSFSAPSDKVNEIEQKLQAYPSIIRQIMVNMDEALERMEKDRLVQAKLKRRPVTAEDQGKPARPIRRGGAGGKIEIDLDAEIEKALESPDEQLK